jgi:hypothetical protein
VQSLATWWTDTTVHRMRKKFSPFEKQSANQILLSFSDRENVERFTRMPEINPADACTNTKLYKQFPCLYRCKKARSRRASIIPTPSNIEDIAERRMTAVRNCFSKTASRMLR